MEQKLKPKRKRSPNFRIFTRGNIWFYRYGLDKCDFGISSAELSRYLDIMQVLLGSAESCVPGVQIKERALIALSCALFIFDIKRGMFSIYLEIIQIQTLLTNLNFCWRNQIQNNFCQKKSRQKWCVRLTSISELTEFFCRLFRLENRF